MSELKFGKDKVLLGCEKLEAGQFLLDDPESVDLQERRDDVLVEALLEVSIRTSEA